MFCSQCGKPLIPTAVFCSNCGSRAASAAPQAPASQPPQPVNNTAPGGEATVLVLSTTRKYSLTKAVACHIVFKGNWLVLAHMTPNLQKLENGRLQETFKAQNIGILKRSVETMGFWSDYYKRYFSLATDAIIAEDQSNLVISYSQISGLLFQCSYTTSDEESSYDHEGKLHITLANGETLKFTHRMHHNKDIHNALTNLFTGRLNYKKQ